MGSLPRVIYDEIHYCLTSSNFRREMDDVGYLMLPVQIIGLTATLPVMSQCELTEKMILPDTKFIRMSTNRPNTRYRVQRAQSDEDYVVRNVKGYMKTMRKGKKILIYY